MTSLEEIPVGITNVPLWEEHWRKIHARARDLLDGKMGVIEAAQALNRLSIWTRTGTDADFSVYRQICSDVVSLPVGPERKHWSAEALVREDARIEATERRWRAEALASAQRLADRSRWALAARQRRRSSGHADEKQLR